MLRRRWRAVLTKSSRVVCNFNLLLDRRNKMAWNIPKITEISVGMEINCYACAEL